MGSAAASARSRRQRVSRRSSVTCRSLAGCRAAGGGGRRVRGHDGRSSACRPAAGVVDDHRRPRARRRPPRLHAGPHRPRSRPAPGPVPACWPDGDFSTDDVAHAMGGIHWLAEGRGRIVGHASVVPRLLEADGVPVATGYVEAVATHPDWRRPRDREPPDDPGERAHRRDVRAGRPVARTSTACMRGLGWERWRGPTYVRTADGLVRTEDEDDGIMILRTPRTPPLTGPRRSAASGAPATPGRGACRTPIMPGHRQAFRTMSPTRTVPPARPARTCRASGSLGPSAC